MESMENLNQLVGNRWLALGKPKSNCDWVGSAVVTWGVVWPVSSCTTASKVVIRAKTLYIQPVTDD